MCVAGLNLTTQPCLHRWYELIRACDPANNLQNCPEKLRLEGWERRVDECPFCNGGNHHMSTHRLCGSTTSSASSVVSSPAMSEGGAFTRTHRRGSGGTLTETCSPLSRQSSNCSTELDRATRAREMNERIYTYLACDPHEVLPSAKKYSPTYATAIAKAEEAAHPASESCAGKILSQRQSISRGWQRISQRWSVSSSLFKIV